MKELTLDVWEFRDWLDDKPDVGLAGSAQQCPIARYMKEVFGVGYVYVTPDGASVNGQKVTAPWVRPFITRVDQRSGTVTGRQAIEILDRF